MMEVPVFGMCNNLRLIAAKTTTKTHSNREIRGTWGAKCHPLSTHVGWQTSPLFRLPVLTSKTVFVQICPPAPCDCCPLHRHSKKWPQRPPKRTTAQKSDASLLFGGPTEIGHKSLYRKRSAISSPVGNRRENTPTSVAVVHPVFLLRPPVVSV